MSAIGNTLGRFNGWLHKVLNPVVRLAIEAGGAAVTGAVVAAQSPGATKEGIASGALLGLGAYVTGRVAPQLKLTRP